MRASVVSVLASAVLLVSSIGLADQVLPRSPKPPRPPRPPQGQGADKARPPTPRSEIFGSLSVDAEPWANVVIDGTPMGRTPLSGVELRAGQHSVLLVHPELGRETRMVVIEAGQASSVSHVFSSAGGGGGQTPYLKALGSRGVGALCVSSSSPGQVIVDDVDTMMMTPLIDHELFAGSHRVIVRFVAGGEERQDVTIRAGERVELQFTGP